MPHCKICGKEFAAEKGVRAHIQSMTKGDHEGIGYSTADPHIGESDSFDDPTDNGEESFDKSGPNATTENQGNEDNPLMTESDSQNEPDGDRGANARSTTSASPCPNCGEMHDESEVRRAQNAGDTDYAWCDCGHGLQVVNDG